MKIIREGTLPENEIARGYCKNCGCIIEDKWENVPKYPNGFNGHLCPTNGCGKSIKMTVTKWHLDPIESGRITPREAREILKK